ncbi:hypothetical protein ACFV27_01265 [Streptomyces antimycoticus]|uniref:hypothetical protein n=1 Tax=Streptomyces antimycoticus TaxID=68175 RepID=UPI0036B05050
MSSRAEVVCLATIALLFTIPATAWWIKRLGLLGSRISKLYRKIRQRVRTKIQRAIFNLLTNDDASAPNPRNPTE